MSLDADGFRAVLGRFATGVTVVTSMDADSTPHGMTVSAFASVSLEPPLIVICIDKTASMHDQLVHSTHFAVNLLTDSQEALGRRFADVRPQRFDGIGYRVGQHGAPLLDDVLAHVECVRRTNHDAGDHTMIIGETLACGVRDGRPLLYYRGGFAQLER